MIKKYKRETINNEKYKQKRNRNRIIKGLYRRNQNIEKS